MLPGTEGRMIWQASEREAAQEGGQARRRRRYWLIVNYEGYRMEALTADLDGLGEALPVFGFEEEAEMFLFLSSLEACWTVKETSTGELLSIIYGQCRSVDRVALDPLPREGARNTPGFVSRRYFARLLAD
jgi:hypothetical protein